MNSEYNLDFFEAMEALKQGKIVEVSYDKKPIQLVNHTLAYFNSNSALCLTRTDFAAKWRIVEPEPKCWLELYGKPRFSSHQAVVIDFAHEAIRRIESKQKQLLDTGSDAIEILKDMIGEK